MIFRSELLKGPFRRVVREGVPVIVRQLVRRYEDVLLECGHVVVAPARRSGHPPKARCPKCRDLRAEGG